MFGRKKWNETDRSFMSRKNYQIRKKMHTNMNNKIQASFTHYQSRTAQEHLTRMFALNLSTDMILFY